MEVPTLTIFCREGRPPADDIFAYSGCPQPISAPIVSRRCASGWDGSEPGRNVERSPVGWLSYPLPAPFCWAWLSNDVSAYPGASPWRGS
jgi:hypothetical protein